ncbi:MAG: iron export ABC transporter permease subunit FetB [Candidatus Krumholzibacteria bacterium]|jgi:putative ABC transport system permease protein|nr:iron export ABC transporter permease subunit FetB [Candidatus Krumholzibacteria bacterium]MDP7021947.1 iron export ABC transporter permease subunit FetB [Candidatus Krumholzibacteria bacterium]
MREVIPLGVGDLAIASTLVLLAGLLSFSLKLRLEKRLAWAAFRSVVQLLLVGYVLESLFQINRASAVLILALFMIAIASHAALRRSSRKFSGALSLSFLALTASAMISTLAVSGAVIGIEPWYQPRYFIPLLGMVLGNGMNGISLCLDEFLSRLDEGREEVEMELAHGASRWEAALRPLREAVRRGMVPVINAMSIVGIVALPGMMTGQILAGADPLQAVKYQIVVMFMIASATGLGATFMALLAFRKLFNSRHQLLSGRIRRRPSP